MQNRKWCVFAFLFCIAAISCSQAAVPSNAKVTTRASFRCKWWSEEQMNGLDPNNPPPKNTEINISKWDYSDPVGTPHPDVVDFLVEIKNESDTRLEGIAVNIEGQWQTGPFAQAKLAKWDSPASLKSDQPFSLSAGETRNVRVSVGVAKKMAELKTSKGWPYAFRGKATVSKSGTTLATAQAQLDIATAD
jgi:hypothetical protein